MFYRVTFIQRDGTPGKPTLFHNVEVANLYAKSVMGTVETVEDNNVGEAVASRLNGHSVSVKVCEPGTAELQKDAARARFFAERAGEAYQTKAVRDANRAAARAKDKAGSDNDSEAHAEAMSEHFMDSKAAGQSMEDAFDDWFAKQGF